MNLTFSNILAGLSGMFYFLKVQSFSKDFILPLIIALSVFFLSRVFLGNAKHILTKLILIFTSSIIVSELAIFLYDIANINKGYTYSLIALLSFAYIKFISKTFSASDFFDETIHFPYKHSLTNKHIDLKDAEDNDFIESVKTQYI